MHLAQINIATAKYELDSDDMADFMNNLAPINAIAEASEGFIWRLQDDVGDATQLQYFDNPLKLTNMSVWKDVASLKQFMFKTHHKDFLARKTEWFEKMQGSSYVMWWIDDGHIPTVQEGLAKLEYLNEIGESEKAFTFRSAAKYCIK